MEPARPLRNSPWPRTPAEHPRIVVCLTDPRLGPRLQDAYRGRATVDLVTTYAEVRQLVGQHGPDVAGIVVATNDESGAAAVPFLRQFTRQWPNVPVTACCWAGIEHSPEIRTLAAAGVHEFLFHGIDGTGTALRAVLASATRECATDAIMRRVSPLLPSRLHAFVVHAVAHPVAMKRLRDVAQGIGLSQRTLTRYCDQEQFPPPVVLFGWCRLFPAAYLLGTTARTVESIALELDFASDTALRNQIKHTLGCRASDVRARGGLDFVVKLFGNAIDMARQRRVSTPHPENQPSAPSLLC